MICFHPFSYPINTIINLYKIIYTMSLCGSSIIVDIKILIFFLGKGIIVESLADTS